jgi:hypothetical protein
VLDNFNNPTYADGFAGSVYGVNPPMANPVRKPGEWQVYDIVFRRPLFVDGKEVDPGYLTVFVNGVLVQDHTPLEGGGGHKRRSQAHPFPEKGPLKLQDHGNPVRYRNIWYRPLPKRALEGGDTSVMSPEATTAKRKEIARGIREAAAKLEGNNKMLHLLESLTYDSDAAVMKDALAMADAYAKTVKDQSAAQLHSMKNDIIKLDAALQYLTKFKLIPEGSKAAQDLRAVIVSQDWEKKK